MKVFAGLPILFEANNGQTDPRVKFLSRGAGYTLFLTRNEAVLSLPAHSSKTNASRQTKHAISQAERAAYHSGAGTPNIDVNHSKAGAHVRPDVLTMRLVGADPAAEITGQDAQKSVSNYFNGNDPKNWHTRVPNYSRVKYSNVYPGVDQVYYGNQNQLESDFLVAPGADPSAIALEIRGARHLHLDARGNLILTTHSGEMRLLKPVLYQPSSGAATQRSEVQGSFVLRGPNRVGFAIGAYDRARPLVIDPAMSFFSYFSGDGNDVIRAVAVDQQGNMYVTGQTTSDIEFPPYQVAEGCQNNLDCAAGAVFVFKISSIGAAGSTPQLAYFNFFFVQIVGRTVPPNGDIGNALAVDSQGNAYVAGKTTSGDFGTVNPCQGCSGDSFVAELDPAGNIIFSTMLAGLGSQITGLALDSASPPHIFVGGTLAGNALTPNTPNGFTPVNAFQQSGPAANTNLTTGFVAELGTGTTACAGSSVTQDCVLYATFFGGTSGSPGDFINGIAVDNQGLVYITGTTSTTDFPVNSKLAGFSQTTCLTTETCSLAFLAKLDPTAGANGLLYSTTLGLPNTGGPVQYLGNAVAVAKDGSGYAYLTGTTGNQLNGANNNNGGLFFPTTPGAIGTSQSSCTPLSGGSSCPGGFVSEINTNATGSTSLVASTYLGGVNGVLTSPNAIAVDAAGNVFVAGGTNSLDFPLPNFAISTNAIQNVLPASAGGIAQPIQSVFLAVLPSGLNNILYSTYLGGSGQGACFPLNDCTVGNVTYQPTGSTVVNDFANAVALDSSGNAYIAGQETSGNFYIAPSAQTLYVNSFDSLSAGNKGWAEIIGTEITPPSTFPIVSLSPANGLNFSNVGLTGSGAGQITVQNTGTAALTVYALAIVPDSGTPTSTFTESDNCQGRSIAISATCIINVTFTPSAIGSYGATLELADNASSSIQTERLTGSGIAPFPEIALTLFQNGTSSTNFNDTVHFGTIQQDASSSTITIQAQNSGTAALVIGNISVVAFGGSGSDITILGDTCTGATLTLYDLCQINLLFRPFSATGTQDALALVIPDNAPDTPQTVALIGTSGTQAPPTALPVLASVDNSVPPIPASISPGVPIGAAHSAVSSGGQFVAFESTATNLPGPGAGIYLRTICLPPLTGCTPITNYISYAPSSGPNDNYGAPCFGTGYLGTVQPAIDTTGQFVAFRSDSCVPVLNATPEIQIYLRNVAVNSTTLISLDDSGNPLNNGMSAYSMSANARYFAYSSSSSNVAGLPNNFIGQIFLRDAHCTPPATTCTPTTLISQETNGNPTPLGTTTEQPSISSDGRYVVFSSSDQNLPTTPPKSFASGAVVLYLRDTCNGATGSCTPKTTAISVDSTGQAVSGDEGAAVASGGRYIIFGSFACSLLPGGCTGSSPEEMYLADTCSYNGVAVPSCTVAPPKIISVNQNGLPDSFLSSTVGPPTITADGRLAMFTSYTPLLANVAGQAIYAYDTCTSNDAPVTNCNTGLHVVSVDSSGTAFTNGSDFASTDPTGQFVSFGTNGDAATTQNPAPMPGGVYLGLGSGFAGATGPALQVSPTAIDFGNVLPPAISATQTITVTNSSPFSTVTGFTVLPATLNNGFSYVTPGSGSTNCQTITQLLPLQSCITQVQFAPSAIGQEISSLAYSATSLASTDVHLTGWGGESAIVFEDMNGNPITSANFGTIQTGTTATLQTQIANVGTAPAGTAPLEFLPYSVTAPFGADVSQCPANLSSLTSPDFPNLLAPGASCIVTLSFTPSATGAASGLLTFVDNAQTSNIAIIPSQSSGETAQSFPLSGTAATTTQAHLILTAVPSPNPALLNSPLTYLLTLTNAGPATAQGITINLNAQTQAPHGAFTSITSSQFTCSPPGTAGPYAICSLNSLAVNASATITFVVTPEEVSSSFNATFFLNETTVDPDPIYDTVNVSVPVITATTGPAVVTDNEIITVTDTPIFPDIVDNEPITVKDTVMVTACTAFTISPSTVQPATIGTPYSQQFTASETGTLTWTISKGLLPTGLTLTPGTGLLSGTPTGSAGNFNFTVTVTDQNGCSASASLSLTLNAPVAGSTITTITSTSSTYQGLALPANLAVVGNPITVNFKVQPASGSTTPSGTVAVSDSFTPADSCSQPGMLNAGTGSCNLTIAQLSSGSTQLTAIYSPDAASSGLLSSTSSPLTESIVQITACGILPTAQTSAQGTTVTFTFSTCLATDIAAAPGAVVTGCPPDAQCSATVTQVSPGVYKVVVTIMLGGSGSVVPLPTPRPWTEPWPLLRFFIGVLFAILMALQLSRQNRARPRLLYAAGLLVALLLSGISGCTSANSVGGGGGGGGTGTPLNTYTMKTAVTAGNFSTSVSLTLTVTK